MLELVALPLRILCVARSRGRNVLRLPVQYQLGDSERRRAPAAWHRWGSLRPRGDDPIQATPTPG